MSKIKLDQKTLVAELKSATDIGLLKEKALHHIAGDKKKTTYAFGIIVVAALLTLVGQLLFSPYFKSGLLLLGQAVHQVIFTVLGILVVSFIAQKLFKGKGAHDAFFRVLGYGQIVAWVALIPTLSPIGGLWTLVILFVALKSVHKLSAGGAIGTLLASLIAMAIMGSLLNPLLDSKGRHPYPDFKGEKDFKMDFNDGKQKGSVKMEDGKMMIEIPQ